MNLKEYYRHLIDKPSMPREKVQAFLEKFRSNPAGQQFMDDLDRLVESLMNDLSNTVLTLEARKISGTDLLGELKQRLSMDEVAGIIISVMRHQMDRVEKELNTLGLKNQARHLTIEETIFYLFTVMYSLAVTINKNHYEKSVVEGVLIMEIAENIYNEIITDETHKIIPQQYTKELFVQNFRKMAIERFAIYNPLMNYDLKENMESYSIDEKNIHPLKALGKEFLKNCFEEWTEEFEGINIRGIGITILSCHLANIHDWQEDNIKSYPWSNCNADTPERIAKIKLFE